MPTSDEIREAAAEEHALLSEAIHSWATGDEELGWPGDPVLADRGNCDDLAAYLLDGGHSLHIDGTDLIILERRRQIEAEGYTPEHDADHGDERLAWAALSYAMPFAGRPLGRPPRQWPEGWHWKPSPDNRVRELVKAGALIAAEIDRLLKETR